MLCAVEQLLDFFGRDPIGQHFVDILRPYAVIGCHRLQILNVAGLRILDSLPDGRTAVVTGPVGVAQENLGVSELTAAHVTLGIDAQDLTAVQLDLGGLAQLQVELFEGSFEDGFGAGVDIEAELFVVVNADWVIALDQIISDLLCMRLCDVFRIFVKTS